MRYIPQVSVCIPAYNGQAYLSDTIESVLQQSLSSWELVICDDASTDDTPDICRSFDDPRVRYIRFDENGGQAANWNRCVDATAGEYVILLHQDDLLARRYLERATNILDRHREVGLVHCSVQHVEAKGDHIVVQRLYDEDRVEPGEVLWRQLMLRGCVVNPAGVMVRKQAYETVGPFTTRIVYGVDWHMWSRIALRFDVAYLAETLAFYRKHGQSATTAVAVSARNGSDELWAVEDVFGQIGESRSDLLVMRRLAIQQVAHRTWCMAEDMCRHGFMRAARTGIRRAVKTWPGMVFQERVWGLWIATYVGYKWFWRMRQLKSFLTLDWRSRRSSEPAVVETPKS